jgi:hypothetical protein
MAKRSYVFKKRNDLDIRFLLSDITEEKYNIIASIIESVAQSIRSVIPNVCISDVVGPAQYPDHEEMTLLLHWIVFTEKTLGELPKLHKYSYGQNYVHLYGEDILQSYKSITYSAKNICYDTEGIFYCIDMLTQRKLRYQKWIATEGGMVTMAFEKEMCDNAFAEVLRYSVEKTVFNCHAWLNWEGFNTDSDDLCSVLYHLSVNIDEDAHQALLRLRKREYGEGYLLKHGCEDKMISLLSDVGNSILDFEKTRTQEDVATI